MDEMLKSDLHGSSSRTKLGRTAVRRVLLCLLIVISSAACTTTTPYDPFRIPDSELRERVQTIALAPLRVSPWLAEPAFARAQIETLAAARLVAGDFKVVPSAEMERLWRSIAADVGNLFDPESGEVDDEHWEAVEAAVYRDLQSEHGVDAILYLRIGSVDLHIPPPNPLYCGIQDSIYWPNRNLGFSEYTKAKRSPTLARALCLNVSLYDMEERMIYGMRSGLELIETFASQTKAKRPLEERLRDPERLERAIEAAIGPLAGAALGP